MMQQILWQRILQSTSFFVSVHVVSTRNTCQPIAMLRNIATHDDRAPFLPRAMGSNPCGSAGLHPRPQSSRGGVGGHRPALGGDGSALDGAAAARLAPVFAAPVERSAPGDRETAPARTPWTSAWRATRACTAAAG